MLSSVRSRPVPNLIFRATIKDLALANVEGTTLEGRPEIAQDHCPTAPRTAHPVRLSIGQSLLDPGPHREPAHDQT